MRRHLLYVALCAPLWTSAPAAAEIGQPSSEYERESIPRDVENDIVTELMSSPGEDGEEPPTRESAERMARLLRAIHGEDCVILAARFNDNANTIDFRLLNPTDRFLWNIEIEVGQRDSTYETLNALGRAMPGGSGSTHTFHLPYMPPGFVVNVSVPVTIQRDIYSYRGSSISVEHDTYLEASRLDAESVAAMIARSADAEVGPMTIRPANQAGTLAAQALRELTFDEPRSQLISLMAATPEGRAELAAFVRGNPSHPAATNALESVYTRDREAFGDLVRGISEDGAALASTVGLMEARPYEAAVQALAGDPTSRPRLWALLARCTERARCDALARRIEDGDRIDVALAMWSSVGQTTYDPELDERKAVLISNATELARQDPAAAARLAGAAAQASIDNELSPAFTAQAAELRTLAPEAYLDVYVTALSSVDLPLAPDALRRHSVDLVAFYGDRHRLTGCASDAGMLRTCADVIESDQALLAVAREEHVTPAFALAAAETMRRTDWGQAVEVARRYQPWGISTDGLVSHFCDQATSVEHYDPDSAEEYAEAARSLDPDAPCMSEIEGRIAARGRTLTYKRVAQVLLFLLPLAGIGFFGHQTLRKHKNERAKQLKGELGQAAPVGRAEKHLATGEWKRSFAAAIEDARQTHAEDDAEQAKNAASALARAMQLDLTNEVHQLASRALLEADVASLVLTQGDLAVYVAALPGMTDHPQTLPRYRSFRRGFAAHVAEMRAAIEQGGGPKKMLAIALFVRVDASEAALQVAYLEPEGGVLPRYLLRDDEAVPEGVELLTHRFTFRTAGEAA